MSGNPAVASASKGHAPVAPHPAVAAAPSGGSEGSDVALVAAVKSGSTEAFGSLVERHSQRLYAMLHHLAGGDAELAGELVQEAFARAFERISQFAGESAFYTWLYRLARNRALDLLSRSKPKAFDAETLVAVADASQPAGESPGQRPDAAVQQRETQAAVQAALAALPADQRELILLRDFDGLDYAAIAHALDVPEGTVKSRLNRARAALREVLQPLIDRGAL